MIQRNPSVPEIVETPAMSATMPAMFITAPTAAAATHRTKVATVWMNRCALVAPAMNRASRSSIWRLPSFFMVALLLATDGIASILREA